VIFLRVLSESFSQAIQQLTGNRLRSFLTLLGITIGIFCVISVLAAVDSLEDNIVNSFEKLGTDVIYISKEPWTEDPGQNYWKYISRPAPGIEDLKAIERKSRMAEYASLAVFLPGSMIKAERNYVEGAYFAGISQDYDKIVKLDFEEGRYFSPNEMQDGSEQIILGYKLAESLFEGKSGVGTRIKAFGKYFTVCGILKKEGKSLIDMMPTDEAAFLPWNTMAKIISIHKNANWGTMLNVKAFRGVDLEELKLEIASILRPVRGLKPSNPDNFAINQITMLTNIISKVFGVMNTAGFIIGMFAMLVGAFGVANIMFVSVKERTPLIGIKMALGARRVYILQEYLLEAIILCLVGGIAGLGLVQAVMFVLTHAMGIEMFVSWSNILAGLILAIIIGLIAGIAPALQASRMDPVEAIRKN
jgi:putative ABC transport system permease protein